MRDLSPWGFNDAISSFRLTSSDRDHDGLSDWEETFGLDGDLDLDDLSNGSEALLGTDPDDTDSDSDGVQDDVEVRGGSDALSPHDAACAPPWSGDWVVASSCTLRTPRGAAGGVHVLPGQLLTIAADASLALSWTNHGIQIDPNAGVLVEPGGQIVGSLPPGPPRSSPPATVPLPSTHATAG